MYIMFSRWSNRKWLVLRRPTSRNCFASLASQQLARRSPIRCPVIDPIDAEPPPVSPIILRNYQKQCIKAVVDAVKRGHKRVGISLATGSGKTVIFTHLISEIAQSDKASLQTLIMAHRQELVEQAARHCKNVYPNKTIDIEMGSIQASGTADITVASVQSLISSNRLAKFDPKRFKLVLVDEAHHIISSSYMRVLKHFGLHEKQEDSPVLVGVSATFSRSDGLTLGKAIDYIVYHRDFMDMINDKYLSDLIITTVDSHVDLTDVKIHAYDFVASELSAAVNTPEVAQITIGTWQLKANGKRKSTLVFCVDINHVVSLCDEFRSRGIDARYVTAHTKPRDRAETVEAFKNGEFPVLLNCGIFTEGTDIPNIDCIILARPTRSRNLLIQMLGRGMRLHPGKENCHVIDIVSSFKHGLVTTPTLFGLDPNAVLKESSIDDIKGMVASKPKKAAVFRSKSLDLTEYTSIADLLQNRFPNEPIRALSRNAWVATGKGRFYLKGPGLDYVRIEETNKDIEKLSNLGEGVFSTTSDQKYHNKEAEAPTQETETEALAPAKSNKHYLVYFKGGSENMQSRYLEYDRLQLLLIHNNLQAAVRAADMWASRNFPSYLTSAYSKWRSEPVTTQQLSILNDKLPEEYHLGPTGFTRGQASDMIMKLKHGGKGLIMTWRKKILEKQKKLQEKTEKQLQDVPMLWDEDESAGELEHESE